MTTEARAGHTALVALGGALAGALLVTLVLLDPLGLGLGDGLHSPPGRGAGGEGAVESESGLWTCGMHPNVIQNEPGICPICQMNLVPLRHVDHVGGDHDAAELPRTAGDRQILFYRHPMNPDVTSPVPAKDEMGMDYVPIYADQVDEAHAEGAVILIDSAVVQNMNVRTAPVERRDLYAPIRTVGSLDYDQRRMVTVTTKYSGWVEKVHVNYVGQPVERGEPLFEVYSPELVQTAQELFSALAFARDMRYAPNDSRGRAESLVDAARTRLGYWDISSEQIERLEETREVFRTLTVVAPASGFVMKRMEGLEGKAVGPGMEIFHIADISRLWLLVEIFEDQVVWVREGTPADITLPYFPGKTFHGKVRFLEPEFSEATRTMRVKIEVANPRGELRKGMFATVVFEPRAVEAAVAVPSQAILRTGQRNVVVVALGEGRFVPREVVVGHEAEGWAEILEGLEAGQEVVVSSQFLLDSESKLREAIQKMIAQKSATPTGDVR